MKSNCSSRKWCRFRQCEDPEYSHYINEENCTCKECLQRSENKNCEYSGDAYNTDFECIMEK